MPDPRRVLTTLSIDEDDTILLEFPEDTLEITGWKEGDILDVQTFPGRVVICVAAEEKTLMGALRGVLE